MEDVPVKRDPQPKSPRVRHYPNFAQYDTPNNRRLMKKLIGAEHTVQDWYHCYYSHVNNSASRGMPSKLSFKDYMVKLGEAGITRTGQIGRNDGQYCLRRYEGVTGPFTKTNCQFRRIGRLFEMTAPDGKTTYQSSNVTAFAEEHGLTTAMVRGMLKGRVLVHKGWTGHYLDEAESKNE